MPIRVFVAAALALAGVYAYIAYQVWRARRELRFLTRKERLRLRAWRTAALVATAALLASTLAVGISYLLSM